MPAPPTSTTHERPATNPTSSVCQTCLGEASLHTPRPLHERDLEWHDPTTDREPCPDCYPHPQPPPDWPAQRANTPEATMTTSNAHPINRQRVDWAELYAHLIQPFDDADLRYRVGAISKDKTKAQALPYVDPRAYEDRLNRLVPGDWSVTFEPWGDHRIICRLTIHGVTRSSTGEASDSPDTIAGTSAEAQAFKRACTKFGLGRYLYAIEPTWTDYDPTTRKMTPPKSRASRAPSTGRQGTPGPVTASATAIGQQRAAAMQRALEGTGIRKDKHLAFASVVLQRQIDDLAGLSPHDAATVWYAASSHASPVAPSVRVPGGSAAEGADRSALAL